MSVKFQEETIQQTVQQTAQAAQDVASKAFDKNAPLPGTSGKHPISEAIGTALTGGKTMAGTKGYLATYVKTLEKNPLRTKMLTAGTLAGAQELIASWLAKDRNKHGNYFTSRVPKMVAYGALISAPMGHFMIWLLQRIFKGRTSLRAKILQILVSNLVIAPIQNSIYLLAMAIIAGARTFHQVRATVKVGFWRVMRVSWLTSPICLAFAQQFLPDELWVPFFNLVSFVIGTYINTITKKKRLAALRKKHFGDRDQRDPRDPRDNRGNNMGRPEDYPPPMGPNPHY
ncbi:PXMP2/4 family 3-like protein [Cladobotryum mycophilum]|uniref:PXMP2/4 family 3-like protein n=1 Tax=Cladobotryum mycophilum TaxID=491253 RepID=A0ABR0SS74_9HYPO